MPQLVALGVLTPPDGHALATQCDTLERYKACQAAIAVEGLSVASSQGASRHPLLTELKR